MRREAWIGLAASLVLHGVVATLLVLAVDARPPVMEGGGDAGSRTRVRLVARPGAEGGGAAEARAESGGAEGGGESAARAESAGLSGGATAKTRDAPIDTAPSAANEPRRGDGPLVGADSAPGTGNDATMGSAEGAGAGSADAPGAGPGDGRGAGSSDGSGPGTGDGSGTGDGFGAGTGTGSGDGSATTAGGGSPGANDDRHARAIATLSSRLSSAARTCYPAAAKRMRLRGEVAVRFCLDGSGRAISLEVENGSGSPLLDRAALECVVPRALPVRDAGGCFSLPVRFGE